MRLKPVWWNCRKWTNKEKGINVSRETRERIFSNYVSRGTFFIIDMGKDFKGQGK